MDYGTAVNAKQSYPGNGALVGQEVQQSIAGEMDNRLRLIWERLCKLNTDMEMLADRAFGPVPQRASDPAVPEPNQPAFHQIERRISHIEATLGAAEDTFQRLHQIA